MKQYKKIIAAVAAAAILALPLSGCSFNDVMLYLYGGDSFTKEEGEDYQTYDGENGISVTYDANIWNEPSMSQEDTIGITTGNKLSYTAVLLQVSDVYTDFLEESAAELNEEAQTVRYDFDLTIPDAETESVRYDCGTYQMILAEVNYDCGVTLHVSAASRSASYDQIVALLEKGDAQLSQSLSLFEEGTKLAAACRTELDKAEQQVVRLMKGPDGAPIENEFASEE